MSDHLFPATKIAPLLRAVADPEGKDRATPEQAEAIRRVEANLAPSTCEWCSTEVAAGRKTCGDSHRAKRSRFLRGVKRSDGTIEVPPSDSPLVARQARATGAEHGSGLQCSYPKALHHVTAQIELVTGKAEWWSRSVADQALRSSLSARQLARLEARSK